VDDYASILLDSEEGITTMKHWLHNHLEGDSAGGIGIIYLQLEAYSEISSGYDSGKVILPILGSFVNHSMAIVGYDDRIEYDVNGDGQITTNIDINNDGIIDVKDWEKGAVILANSYGTEYWGNNGFVYLMYHSLALSPAEGGIWNRSMYVVKPKLPTMPKVTFRFTMEHQNKSKIVVSAGISQNRLSTTPDYSVEIPFLKYIAKSSSISGDTNGISTPVEFGFDATPLLNHISSGTNPRFFLQVYEIDPDNKYSGSIKSFSVIDYTHGAKEWIANTASIPIQNNAVTTLYVNCTPEFSKPKLTEDDLPKVNIGTPYISQLTATQGTPPYRFKQLEGYQTAETTPSQAISNGQTPLTIPNGSTASIAIDCQFPLQLYDSIHTGTVYINPHGYIQFHDYEYYWPFNQLDYTQLKEHTTIAPLMSYFAFDKPEFGVWYTSTPDSLYVNWRCRFVADSTSTLSFSATIFKNGNIQFHYDPIQYNAFNPWVRGISKGNGVDMTKFGGDFVIEPLKNYFFTKQSIDTSIQLNTTGILSFTPSSTFTTKTVHIALSDNNDLESTGTIQLSATDGADIGLISYSLGANNTTWFSTSDTIRVAITIKNYSNVSKQNVGLKIAKNVSYLDFIKKEISVSEILPYETITIPNAFVFKLNALLETELSDFLNITTINNQIIGTIKTNLTPFIPIEVSELIIDSLNANVLIPNSNQTMLFPIKNRNRFPVYHLKTISYSNSSEIIIQNEITELDSIAAYASDTIRVKINTQNLDSPNLHITLFGKITADKGMDLPYAKTFSVNTNKTENYEDAQHPLVFNSIFSDTIPLKIANTGYNSNKSWLVIRPSTLKYTLTRSFQFIAPESFTIEFDYKTDIRFLPNKNRVSYLLDHVYYGLDSSSNWKHKIIPVTKGIHSFSLELYAEFLNDSIYIDNLSMPIYAASFALNYEINPDEVKLKCKPDTLVQFTLEHTGLTDPLVSLEYQVIPFANQKADWLTESGVIILPKDQTQSISYNVNTAGLASGNYTSYLRFYDQCFYTPVKVSLEVLNNYHPPADGSILVYPNPAKDKISFDFINTDEPSAELTLYDIMGSAIFYQKQSIDFGSDLKFVSFDISNASWGNSTQGLYLYQLKVGTDIYHGKITIIH